MSFEVANTLGDIYDAASVPAQTTRYKRIHDKFVALFGEEPDFYARSPGRVNLIGEHIDYSYYSVLPMALSDKDIVIAVRKRVEPSDGGAVVRVANVDAKFPTREIGLKSRELGFVEIDAAKHEWSNYFLSGVKGVLGKLGVETPVSMDCLVDGSVPTGAGVSSSSAFVCCSALAAAKVYDGNLSMKELTEVAIVSERFVGVESGGMDQSCSILGLKNAALAIHFYPTLDFEAVPLPKVASPQDEPIFVIAHTMVTSDKHVTAPVCYNLRVVETRFASLLLAKKHFAKENWEAIQTLRSFQEAFMKNVTDKPTDKEGLVVSGLQHMLKVIEADFDKKDGYTLEEISALLEIPVAKLTEKYMSKFPVRASVFHLYRRAKHVFSEALRVYEFKKLCSDNQNSGKPAADIFAELGVIMNKSQDSCRDLFDCSCPELDQLCQIARESGAFGSRLTGAGWGGCTVSLVSRSKLEGFLEALKKKYFAGKTSVYDDVLFHSPPGRGAVYLSSI